MCQLPAWLRGKLDPDDSFANAALRHENPRSVRDRSTSKYSATYGRALNEQLIDATRKFAREHTAGTRDDFAQSCVRLADWLAAGHTSPSERAERNEQFLMSSRRALVGLPRRAAGRGRDAIPPESSRRGDRAAR